MVAADTAKLWANTEFTIVEKRMVVETELIVIVIMSIKIGESSMASCAGEEITKDER